MHLFTLPAPQKPLRMTRVARIAASAAALCASVGVHAAPPAPHTAPAGASQPGLQRAYTLLGSGGAIIARAITTAPACPSVDADGKPRMMVERVAPGEPVVRKSAQDVAKAARFNVRVCELTLPPGTRKARINGPVDAPDLANLPLPKDEPKRIVIVGDSGCRIKASDEEFQDCNNPAYWPFAAVSQAAAEFKPDLVIHVGDYLYRESPCPSGRAGCSGSVWGYGYDVWTADLFEPAAPLLRAAPWVFARGNHESCERAGQGWFRFLDSAPYDSRRNCDIAANDDMGNFSEPYAVPLGADYQLLVFDSAKARNKAYTADDLAYQRYTEEFARVGDLIKARPHNIFLSHHPVLGFASSNKGKYKPGNQGLQSVLAARNPGRLFDTGIELALHGHVHMFQALNFTSGHPATIVAGNSGDTLETPLKEDAPDGIAPAPGAALAGFFKRSDFGFLTMERSATGWTFTERDVSGVPITDCLLRGSDLRCTPAAPVSVRR